jgi:hypothetical protein
VSPVFCMVHECGFQTLRRAQAQTVVCLALRKAGRRGRGFTGVWNFPEGTIE